MLVLILGCALFGIAVSIGAYRLLSPSAESTAINDDVLVRTGVGAPPPGAGANLHEVLLARSRSERVFKPWLRRMSKFSSAATSRRRIDMLAEMAATAGIASRWTPPRIMAARFATLIAGLLGAWQLQQRFEGIIGWALAAIVAGIGWRAFDVYLVNRARLRQETITMELPDVADQIAISVQAGLSFEQAMRRTVDSTTGPLSRELDHFLQDVRVGLTRSQAFKSLQARVDVPDVSTFIRAIAQAEKTGVSIGEILQIQADELREKRKQRAEERAMKLPVLMLMPLVSCILPPLLIVLLGPAVITVMQTGLGT